MGKKHGKGCSNFRDFNLRFAAYLRAEFLLVKSYLILFFFLDNKMFLLVFVSSETSKEEAFILIFP